MSAAPALVLPAGLDLRTTWPERQLLVRRNEYRRGQYKLADTDLPFLPDFIARCGGKMPETFAALSQTEYAASLGKMWERQLEQGRITPVLAQLMFNASARYSYAVEWWEYEGRRSYLLDAVTAHALLETNMDDFPADQLRLPVRSFFIRFPAELGWTLSMDRPDVTMSVPREQHPELVQPLDGVHITADGEGGRLERLQAIIAGRSARAPEGDHVIWAELAVSRQRTLGEVIGQTMKPQDGYAAALDLDRKVLRMALGAVLYITSSHPELRPIEPPSNATLAKATRSGDPAKAARAQHRSRYAITYVGGPQAGFRTASASGEPGGDFTRRPPRPHVRAGHMRHVWLGPRDGERRSEVRWIQPVMVGSWDRIAAWKAEQGYRFHISKTRPAERVPNDSRS